MRAAHWACVNHQKEILASVRPDVVVASSWGAVVALRCLELGYYTGPSVLLAPAVKVRGWWSWLWSPQFFSIPPEVASQCMVVCGECDETVSVSAVEKMCKDNDIGHFQRIPAAGHRLNTALIHTDKLRKLIAKICSQ